MNDAYGHMFGDQLLQSVSLAILSCLDDNQLLARFGGDEFIVLATETSQSTLEATASRILTRLRQPFRIGLIEVYTGCSIGISLAPQHGQDCESVIRNADTAMYTAKEGGRGQFCVFSPEMNQRVFEYLWLDTNLRKALENDQLVIHYQPKITREAKCAARRRWYAGSLRNAASFHHWNLSPTPKNQGLLFRWGAGLFWTLCVRLQNGAPRESICAWR